ncbi:MAG TPA: hypothetical protein VMU51_35590 [Mycobacteriales bacterium]|nr:hypothetical protein [Mycobacteriales bacterium]
MDSTPTGVPSTDRSAEPPAAAADAATEPAAAGAPAGTLTEDRPEPAADQAPGGQPGQAQPDRRWALLRRPFEAGQVTLGELIVLAAAAAVGVVAVISLATAHLGIHRLGTVLPISAGILIVFAVLAWFGGGRPRIALDLPGLLVMGGSGLLSGWLLLPGFHYVAGDKDPGGYVMHAFEIARSGSYQWHDPLLTTAGLPVQLQSPGARFPGIWVHDMATGQIVPQFYHLWSATMATSYDLRGYGGLANTGAVCGVLAVLAAVVLARRLGGIVAAGAVGLILATNMMEVWQAKYPTAEILAQFLYLGTLLGIVLAVQTRWRWPALLAGVLVGAGYLDRADGLLLVLAAVGGLACLWVLRRFDARAAFFAVGLAVVLPYGLWQAYGPAGFYTRVALVPKLPLVLAAIGVSVAGALVLRPVLTPLAGWLTGRLALPGFQRRTGLLLTLGAFGLFLLGLARPLFETDTTYYGPRLIRTYDERNLYRLSWFFSWPGLVLVLVGIAVVLLSRWSPSAWVVLGMTGALLTLYAWHAKNSPYFMWVGRRFVPTVIPGMVLLIGLALAWIWAFRRPRVPRLAGPAVALGLAGFIAAVQLNQSVPLRSHDEWGGSYGVTRAIGDLSGDKQGVYLWQPPSYCCAAPQTLFASPVWLVDDDQSVLLPGNPASVPGYVRAYLEHFPDRPVFLVYDRTSMPPKLPGISVAVAGQFAGTLPHWVESSVARPAKAQQIPYNFTVYRVQSIR